MSKTKGATAENFLAAFKAMPKKEQNLFFADVLKDKNVREDLVDIAIAESRAKDKGGDFKAFLKSKNN